jgi:pimeloyl-ACP methyl ester carboxylesterase
MTTILPSRHIRRGALIAAVIVLLAGALVASNSSAAGARKAGVKPTIVLVHGAWADASSWNGVTRRLQADGYTVLAPANPLRSLSGDAAYLRSLLATISGPIVLVGHSYGGAVITNAATGNANVKALVYVDAFVPDTGDTVLGLAAMNPGSDLTPATLSAAPYTDGTTSGVDLYIKPADFRDALAGDVPPPQAAIMAASQRPISLAAATEPSGAPAWKEIPSWDLIGTQDHAIPPATQEFMAKRADSHTVEIKASHLSMVSHPADVTHLILDAVNSTG